jgi:hypothetical protein
LFTSIALVVSALARPGDWLGSRARQVLPMALLAAVMAAIALLPFLIPYLLARREQVMFVRTIDEVGKYSATWANYLATGGTFHIRTWSARFWMMGRGDGLFPGFVALALTLGFYVATAIYLALAMRVQGGFRWLACVAVAAGTSLFFFAVLEVWFKVPLLKGPLEALFGYR